MWGTHSPRMGLESGECFRAMMCEMDKITNRHCLVKCAFVRECVLVHVCTVEVSVFVSISTVCAHIVYWRHMSMASKTGKSNVCSKFLSCENYTKKASYFWPFLCGYRGDRWIPLTKGLQSGKRFDLIMCETWENHKFSLSCKVRVCACRCTYVQLNWQRWLGHVVYTIHLKSKSCISDHFKINNSYEKILSFIQFFIINYIVVSRKCGWGYLRSVQRWWRNKYR